MARVLLDDILTVQAIDGADIDKVGVPNVVTSQTGGTVTLEFNNLKGKQGDSVGDVTATVDNKIGQVTDDNPDGHPTVEVVETANTPNEWGEKTDNFAFNFKGLRGHDGDNLNEVTASVDNTIGIPDVQVTQTDGNTSEFGSTQKNVALAFTHLRGQDGDSIGNVTATIDNSIGIPAVTPTVTDGNTNEFNGTKKNLNLSFEHLRGQDGDNIKTVYATIDNTIGVPTVTATTTDGTTSEFGSTDKNLQLDFTHLRGRDGDTLGDITATIDNTIGTPEVTVTETDGATSEYDSTTKNYEIALAHLRGKDGNGIGSITASIDDTIGTPTIAVNETASTTNEFDGTTKDYNLSFEHIRGKDGDTIGTVTATIDDTIGTPIVTVNETDGDTTDLGSTSKNYSLTFEHLSGKDGDKLGTITATIDNSIGTPDVTVTETPSTPSDKGSVTKDYSLAFSNLKGDKGDGVTSVDVTCDNDDPNASPTVDCTLTPFPTTSDNATNQKLTINLHNIKGRPGDLASGVNEARFTNTDNSESIHVTPTAITKETGEITDGVTTWTKADEFATKSDISFTNDITALTDNDAFCDFGDTTPLKKRHLLGKLWTWLKAKTDALYALATHTHTKSQITDFPAINNGTLTITQNGTTKGTFTANQSGNTTIALTDNNTTYSSLKNPYAMTLQFNGSSQTAYDGSAARTYNITPAGIGAAASSHSHSNYVQNNTTSEQTITGNIRLKNSSNYGMKLLFGDGSLCYLYESSDDLLTIHTSHGVVIDGGALRLVGTNNSSNNGAIWIS